MDILSKIQVELKAQKNQRNNFGNYNYRSCEDILEGLKPLLKETNTSVILSDDIKMIGDRIYVVATAKLIKTKGLDLLDGKKDSIIVLGEATAFAREPLQQKGMNEAQITGSASSYARKYALNGLFAIDDNKDADTNEHHNNSLRSTNTDKPDYRALINNAISKLDQKVKEDYIKLLKDGIMPVNEATYNKICKDNNINA